MNDRHFSARATLAAVALATFATPQFSVAQTLSAGTPASLAPSTVLSIHVQPWARCTISFASGTDFVGADSAGIIRFYPPPASWGSTLDFDCTPGSADTSTQHTHVDLTNPSTFAIEPSSFAGPGVIGVRPPLTASQLALPSDDLLKMGYPPRPTQATHPDEYARWLRVVSTPMNIVSSALVYDFRAKAANFAGRFGAAGTPNVSNPWTALVLDTTGFPDGPNTSSNPYANPLAALDFNYSQYLAIMYNVPFTCGAGICFTSFWGGIGGYAADWLGYYFTPLIQSGLYSKPDGSTGMFTEYIGPTNQGLPANVAVPPGMTMATDDEIWAWGYPASDGNCDKSYTGAYACFGFIDYTHDWSTYGPGPAGTVLSAPPSNTPFVGSTAEGAVELMANGYNAGNGDYGFNGIDLIGYDWNNNSHSAASGDPYIFLNQPDFACTGYCPNNTGNLVNSVTFSTLFTNFPDNDPQPWVWFYWQSTY